MFRKKAHLIIAMTTCDMDVLKISVPPLARVAHRTHLVIHNDNPEQKLGIKDIRHLGWRGKITIINSEQNLGELESKIQLINHIKNIPSNWVMLVDDDDVVINTDIPNVSATTFAIIQNATTLRDNLVDVLRINPSWSTGTKYGTTGPHFDIRGTLVRHNILTEFCDFITPLIPQMQKLAHTVKYRIPTGAILWNGLNTFMHNAHPEMSPIYMGRTNYVVLRLGRATNKYGLRNAPKNADVLDKYNEMFEIAIKQNMVASDK